MSRFLVWVGLALAAVVIVIGLIVQTDWARDRIIAAALDAGVDAWSVERIDGRLLTDLTISGLELEAEGIRIRVGQLEVRPALERILFGQIAVRALNIDDLDVTLPAELPEGDPATEPADIRLPLAVALDLFQLRRFRLAREDETLVEDLDLSLRLRGMGQNLDIDRLRLAWPDQGLSVQGEVGLSLAASFPFTALLDLRRQDPEETLPTIATRIIAASDGERIEGQARLTGDIAGNVLLEWSLPEARGRVRADVNRLTWAALPEPFRLRRLELEAGGAIDDLTWSLALDTGWDDMRPHLRAEGHLGPERVELRRAEVIVDDNVLTTHASMDLTAPLAFSADVEGRNLDLAPWIEGFPTRLDVTTSITGQLGSTPSERRIDVHRLAVDGAWGEAPARIRSVASVAWPDDELSVEIDRFEFELGSNRIDGRGRITSVFELDFDAALADLAELWPGIEGAIRGQIGARGTPEAPTLALELEGTGLRQNELSIAEIGVLGTLSLDPAMATDLSFSARAAGSGDQQVDVDGEVSGPWPELQGSLDLKAAFAEARLGMLWQGDVLALDPLRITELEITQALAGTWRLDSPLELHRPAPEDGILRWSSACLTGPAATPEHPARLCLADGALLDSGPELDATLSAFDLGLLADFAPEWLAADGAIAAAVRIRGEDLAAELTASGTDIRIKDPLDLDEIFSDQLEVVHITAGREGSRIHASGEIRATLAGLLSLSAELDLDQAAFAADPAAALEAAPLLAVLDLDVADLAPFAALVPGLSEVGGALSGRLEADGPAGAPELSGRIDLVGRADVPALALDLDPITLTLQSRNGGAELLGRLHTGSQVIELDARADWNLVDGVVASGRLFGDAVPIAALPDLNLTLSPDLNFSLDRDTIRLQGSATVPEARARVRELPPGGDTLSQDVIIHSTLEEAERERPRDFYLDLTVILGDSVHLSAAGLETRLTGRLQLTESPGVPLAARGRLETREGVFSIYGQTLELRTGRLNFEGPLDNPAVDVVAVRQVNSAEVGVRVGGFLDALETQLFSNPQREDVDTLTMLITGRMPGEASSAEMASVSDAALAFGIGQAVPVVGRVVNRLGIDELAVDSPMDEDAGAILVGTQLTDDIYVRYTYGLYSRLGGLQIEYRVNNWLSIQSETGSTQAIDFIFRREFR